MKKYAIALYVMLGMGIFTTSCSSEEELSQVYQGTGTVELTVNPDAGFQSRAVDESYYANLSNYTVQILKNGTLYNNYQFIGTVPASLELEAGDYTLKAFAGKDEAASTKSMYVEGSSNFSVVADQTTTAAVTCKPVCAKVTVTYGSDMAKYFNDYYVTFETQALGENSYIWHKEYVDPVYMRVNNNEKINPQITLVDKNSKIKTLALKDGGYTLSPAQALSIEIVPVVNNGKLQISITVDESTEDKNITIDVPSEWI